MTTGPEDGTVPFEDHSSFEADPTGMRALLSSLPDPGPMPPDLVARIQASLAAEGIAHTPATASQTAPVLPMPPRAGRREGAHIPRRRLSSPPRWLLPAAAALLVLGGGGAAVTGMFQGRGANSGSLSAGAGDMGRESTGGAAATEQDAWAQGKTTPGLMPTEAPAGAPGITFVSAGRAFDASSLDTDTTRLLRSQASSSAASERATAADFGPGGPEGCARRLGAGSATRVIMEAGSYAGDPATLVAYPAGPDTWTANLVGPGCGNTDADRYAGPVSVSTGTKSS